MTSTLSPRPALRAGLAVAALLALSACSGIADDAPTDAEPQAFCDAYNQDTSASEAAAALAEVGTPEDVTGEERNGFELYVEGLDNEGDTPNIEVEIVEIPEDDEADGLAFVTYVQETCTSLVGPPDASEVPEPSEGPS